MSLQRSRPIGLSDVSVAANHGRGMWELAAEGEHGLATVGTDGGLGCDVGGYVWHVISVLHGTLGGAVLVCIVLSGLWLLDMDVTIWLIVHNSEIEILDSTKRKICNACGKYLVSLSNA